MNPFAGRQFRVTLLLEGPEEWNSEDAEYEIEDIIDNAESDVFDLTNIYAEEAVDD